MPGKGKERTEGTPTTLADIKQRLAQRQSGFFTRLTEIGSRATPGTGWERIQTLPSGLTQKATQTEAFSGYFTPVRPEDSFMNQPNVMFTGREYCPLIAGILYNALASSVGKNIKLSWGNIETDMNRENWGRDDYTLSSIPKNHAAVKATDVTTGESIYIDGAYGQVDHTYAGAISIFSESEFADHYRTAAGDVPTFEGVPGERVQALLDYSCGFVNFGAEDVQVLTDVLTQ